MLLDVIFYHIRKQCLVTDGCIWIENLRVRFWHPSWRLSWLDETTYHPSLIWSGSKYPSSICLSSITKVIGGQDWGQRWVDRSRQYSSQYKNMTDRPPSAQSQRQMLLRRIHCSRLPNMASISNQMKARRSRLSVQIITAEPAFSIN